jgi:hypothetical protein
MIFFGNSAVFCSPGTISRPILGPDANQRELWGPARMKRKTLQTKTLALRSALLCTVLATWTGSLLADDSKSTDTKTSSADLAVVWKQTPGQRTRFSLEYENSQRLETLDSAGKPIGPPPELSIPRRIAVDLELDWRRVTRSSSSASLKIVRIRGVALPSWSQRESLEPDLTWDIRARSGKKRSLNIKTTSSARSKLRALAGNSAAAEEFQAVVNEALSDLLMLFPTAKEAITKPGQKWHRTRGFALARELKLKAEFELELLEARVLPPKDSADDQPDDVADGKDSNEKSRVDTNVRVATIEGGVRQEIPGAPVELQRQPGLFPGSIRWVHDLDRGFPRQLRARKIARIPIPDENLPTVKTLTHHYELKIDLTRS